MKKLLLLALTAAFATGAAAQTLDRWTMQRDGADESYSVNVPCTVAGALNEAGALGQNVLEGLNYGGIDKSIFDDAWIFNTEFSAKPGRYHLLRFGGLGYRADIFLNGHQIASADTTFGVFAEREFDVSSLITRNNSLSVRITKAQPGDLNSGYVDWNPRPVDESMGLLRPVELISTPDVVVKDVFVKPELDLKDLSRADIVVTATLVNLKPSSVKGTLKGSFSGGSFREKVELGPGETRLVTVRKSISKPHLWWSWDMGTPYLYEMKVSFRTGLFSSSHSRSVRFGIRSVLSEIDEYGHRLYFLNGRKVLVKSAGWTDDIFMQDTPESLTAQAQFVKDMGLNCIRFENIWGKDDTIYDLCDKLGILAIVGWSCQWEWKNYCGLEEKGRYGCINTPESEALAVRYFHDQIIRMRNHPSVMAWFSGSDRIPNPELENKYLKLFEELDYRPYVCSASGLASLAGPSGNKMLGPYEYVGPDYWYVDTKHGGAYGFNTETGVGMNIPQAENVVRMVGEGNLWPQNEVWNRHCTVSASAMNTTDSAMEAATGHFGEPESFADFMRKAHALDYDGTRSMFESFRCNVPRTTGIVQWMLNSAWPSLYWQLYDWYLVPTAGYYGVKKGLKPVQLVYNYKEHAVYCVNECVPAASYTCYLKIYNSQSVLVGSSEMDFVSYPLQPRKVFGAIEGPCFIALELKDAKGKTVADNFYCVPEKLTGYDWAKTDWWGSPILEYADMSFVTDLPEAGLKMQTKAVTGGYDVTLTNTSDVIAYQNILKALDAGGNLIPAVIWSDNFFTLLPGQSVKVHCTLPKGVKANIKYEGWNGRV